MVKLRHIFLSLIALGVLYANVAVIFHPRAHKLRIGSLPIPEAAYQTFLIFGVFAYFDTSNHPLTLCGLAKKEQTNQTFWKPLPTSDYFPFGRGEQNTRRDGALDFARQGAPSLEPILHLQAGDMVEVPGVPCDERETMTLGGGGNQTVPAAHGRPAALPLRAQISSELGQRLAHQLAQHVRVEQIHALVELRGWRSGRPVPLFFDLLQNFENRIVVGNAFGIEVGSVREALELASRGLPQVRPMLGERIANGPLFRRRQALLTS